MNEVARGKILLDFMNLGGSFWDLHSSVGRVGRVGRVVGGADKIL